MHKLQLTTILVVTLMQQELRRYGYFDLKFAGAAYPSVQPVVKTIPVISSTIQGYYVHC